MELKDNKIFTEEEILVLSKYHKIPIQDIEISEIELKNFADYAKEYKKSKGSSSEFRDAKILDKNWCLFYGSPNQKAKLHKVTQEGGIEIQKKLIDPDFKHNY